MYAVNSVESIASRAGQQLFFTYTCTAVLPLEACMHILKVKPPKKTMLTRDAS